MTQKTLSQQAMAIAGAGSKNFGKAKERKIAELLKPKNTDINAKTVKWQTCKGNW